MKQLQITDYEIRNGCYVKAEQPVTNFILIVTKIVQGTKVDFKVEVRKTDSEVYTKTISLSQLKMKYFLNDLPVYIEDEKEFYVLVRKAILQKEYTREEIVYQTNCNGLQEVNGEKMFVFTNYSIGADGLHKGINSGIQGAYFPQDALEDVERTKIVIEDLFKEYNRNAEVFYPLFFMNIMAISNGYFRIIGEDTFMKLTLWLDGVSGSGKTELAKAVGTYTFYDECKNKELISVTGNRKYALNQLAQSSGMVCVLDDVKQEQVRERKNSVRNIIDDFIRGVFQGRLTDGGTGKNAQAKWMDSCAVITGEYIETNESQNARIFYLKVDGFLKEERNSRALRMIQENPMWLTTVCGGYIRWLLNKMSESSFPELIRAYLKELRNKEKTYGEINNAERLNENYNMLEMATRLTEMYFQEIGMSELFIKKFLRNAKQSIKAISDSTFCLLGGKKEILLNILEAIYLKGKLRRAKYERGYSGDEYKNLQPHFWLNEDDDFLWIEDYERSLEKRGDVSGDTREEYLIIQESKFMKLFKEESQRLVEGGYISSETKEDLQINCMKLLREMQIIFKQYRSDSRLGRPTAKYPIFNICRGECWTDREYRRNRCFDYECGDYEETILCRVHYEPTIQLNVEHALIKVFKERMEEEVKMEEAFENVLSWTIEREEEACIYKVRCDFAKRKSLYKSSR